jgi:hypothetical protein
MDGMNPTILRRKRTAAVLAFLLVFAFTPGVPAAQDITASAQVVCVAMVQQGDTYYLAPGSEVHASYTLKNATGEALTLTELHESIGSAEYTLPLSGQSLAPGQKITITGTSFTAQSAGQYPIQAQLAYSKGGAAKTLRVADLKAAGVHISFTADYQVVRPDVMFSGETYTATYRAAVTSHSNVKLSGVQAYHVPDTGSREALGTPITLPAGEGALWEKDVTASYQRNTAGYLAIQYTDPINGSVQVLEFPDKRVEIRLSGESPTYALKLTGQSDPPYLTQEGEVEISLTAQNGGNASLTDLKVVDWTGKTVLSAAKLTPGQSAETQVRYTIAPEQQVVFAATARVEGTQKTVGAEWNLKMPKGMDIRVERTLIPSVPTVGETFILRYTLTNQGAGDLKDIVIDELKLEKSVELASLAVGETKTVDMDAVIEEASTSQPTIIARDAASGVLMSMDVEAMPIPVAMPAADSLLSVKLTATPLDEESVSLTCTLSNIGEMELKNLEVRLPERDIVMGSVLALSPGGEETLTYEKLVIGDLESVTARADAVLPNGEVITVISEPVVFAELAPAESPDATPLPEDENQGSRILVPVLIAVLVLGAGALAIIFWPTKKKRAKEKPAPKAEKEGGGA